MSYYLYILKSKKVDKYYIGTSVNPERRLEYYNTIEKGFTSRYRPWELVFSQEYDNKLSAQITERKLKSWKSKNKIKEIINGQIKI